MMKSHILYILWACVLFAGCTEMFDEKAPFTPYQEPRYLNVTEDVLSFEAKPSNAKHLHIESVKTPWQINDVCNWLKLSVKGDDGSKDTTIVSVDASENGSGDTLRTNIMFVQSAISDWKYSKAVTVTQSAARPFISPSVHSIVFTGRADTKTLSVQYNTNWTFSVTDSWLRVIRSGNELILNASGNDTGRARTCSIKLTGATTSVIRVEQEPANLTASTDTIKYKEQAGSHLLSIESDLDWSAYTNDSWIDVNPTQESAGTSKLEISVSPNNSTQARTGSVYIKSATKTIKIPVSQSAYYMTANKNRVEFGSHGGTMELSLSTNDTWSVYSPESDWLTLSENKGSNNAIILLNAEENATLTQRSMTLTITSSVCPALSVDVYQNPRYLSTSAKAIAFFGKGGETDPIYIDTDAQYRWEKDADWFDVEVTNNIMIINVKDNSDGLWRKGSITLTVTDLTEGELVLTIPVEQAVNGKSVNIEDFDNDIDWTDDKSEWKPIINILQYREDENWTTNPEHKNSVIDKDGYNADEYWTDNDTTTSSILRINYFEDEDWTNK